jgi:prepilin-type N-terminal cleavage/methylation domain-containing protein
MRAKQKGFTIVELLIVIVVIGILASITIVAFNGVQQRARNAERSHELVLVQKAVEMYRLDNSGYPRCGATGPYSPGSTVSSGTVAACLADELVPTYLASLPVDPQNTGASQYWYAVGYTKTGVASFTNTLTDNYILGGLQEGQAATYSGWANR